MTPMENGAMLPLRSTVRWRRFTLSSRWKEVMRPPEVEGDWGKLEREREEMFTVITSLSGISYVMSYMVYHSTCHLFI